MGICSGWFEEPIGCGEFRNVPEPHRLIFCSCGQMPILMGGPTQAITLSFVAVEFDLWHDLACRNGRVLRLIPDHHSTICAHRRDDIRILRLVSGLVHLSGMVNLLDDIEFDLNSFSARWPPSVTTNLPCFFIVVFYIGCNSVWKLDICNLEEIGSAIGGVCAN